MTFASHVVKMNTGRGVHFSPKITSLLSISLLDENSDGNHALLIQVISDAE